MVIIPILPVGGIAVVVGVIFVVVVKGCKHPLI